MMLPKEWQMKVILLALASKLSLAMKPISSLARLAPREEKEEVAVSSSFAQEHR